MAPRASASVIPGFAGPVDRQALPAVLLGVARRGGDARPRARPLVRVQHPSLEPFRPQRQHPRPGVSPPRRRLGLSPRLLPPAPQPLVPRMEPLHGRVPSAVVEDRAVQRLALGLLEPPARPPDPVLVDVVGSSPVRSSVRSAGLRHRLVPLHPVPPFPPARRCAPGVPSPPRCSALTGVSRCPPTCWRLTPPIPPVLFLEARPRLAVASPLRLPCSAGSFVSWFCPLQRGPGGRPPAPQIPPSWARFQVALPLPRPGLARVPRRSGAPPRPRLAATSSARSLPRAPLLPRCPRSLGFLPPELRAPAFLRACSRASRGVAVPPAAVVVLAS